MKALATEIFEFLKKYAKEAACYDAEYDDPEDRFNGPDSAMFYTAAVLMDEDRKPILVHSDWGSGCYKTHLDDVGGELHDRLRKEVNRLHHS